MHDRCTTNAQLQSGGAKAGSICPSVACVRCEQVEMVMRGQQDLLKDSKNDADAIRQHGVGLKVIYIGNDRQAARMRPC